MPLFYFDIQDGGLLSADQDGTDLHASTVPREARRLLIELARNHGQIHAKGLRLEALVRGGRGTMVHWSSLELDSGNTGT